MKKISFFLCLMFLLGADKSYCENYLYGAKGWALLYHWPANNVHYRVHNLGAGDNNLDYAATASLIQAAYGVWSDVTTSNLTFTNDGSTSASPGVDGINEHVWIYPPHSFFQEGSYFWDDPQTPTIVEGASAITIWDDDNLIFTDVDILYNGNKEWRGTDFLTWYNEVESVAIHEIGHSFGLGHATPGMSPIPVMTLSADPSSNRRELKLDDKKGISFLYGGNLIDDESFSSGAVFNWPITVYSGTTTFASGTSVDFRSGVSLAVNGTLNASGVTFTRYDATGTWNGIQFNSGSSGTIQYCTIQNATNGITFNNTGSASITISNCTIQNNSDNGIYTYNSSPIIANNNIYYNSSNGILCNSYSSPKINNNNIKWNSYSGLRCNYYSNPSASLVYYGSGSNVITWNTMYGILASYNCIVNYGSSGGGGNNSIYLNTLDEIYASYGCTVWAQYNYWGTGSTFNPYQSTIYNEYPLSTDPNPGRSVIAVSNSIARAEGVANFSIYDSNISQSSSSISDDDQYDKDITKLKDLLKTEGNTKFGRTALIELEHTYWKSKKTGFEDFINTEILSRKNVKDELTVMAYELINHSFIEKGDFKKAISNLEYIKKELVLNEEIEKNTLYNLGAIYVNCLGDKNSAAIYFDELKKKYPNDRLSFEADALVGNSLSNGNLAIADRIAKEAENSELDAKLPLSYGLSNCYPNPFNPTTKVSYQLPEKSNVILKIYDALGKEVRTLVNSNKEAGYYSVDFDASGLPSGVYIYQIQAGKFNESKKMLLVK